MSALKVTCRIEGMEELRAKLEGMAREARGDSLARALVAGALVIRNEAAERAPRRTRTLARSIHVEVLERRPERAVVAVGTNLEYARIHEYGGVIRPVRRRNLAIPVGSLFGSPLRWRLRLVITPGGQRMLVDAAGQVQYLLRRAVTIPARPYLRPAVETQGQNAMATCLRVLKQLLEAAL